MSVMKIWDGEKWYPIQTIKGDKGDTGATGQTGADGHTPVITAEKSGKELTIYVDGEVLAIVDDGQDGHSPVVTASKSGKVTTVSVDGTDIAAINDGEDGQNGQDGADGTDGKSAYQYAVDGGYQGTEQEFAQKLADDTPNKAIIAAEYDATATYALGDVCLHDGSLYKCTTAISTAEAWTAAHWTQITVGGDFVKNTDWASTSDGGIVKITSGGGITIDSSHGIKTTPATGNQVKGGTEANRPIVPSNENAATFYGLAKAAGDSSQASSSNTVGTYTDAAKVAIQKMLGIYEAPWELICQDEFTNATAGTYEISVDGDGIGFELTDIQFVLVTPVQDTQAGLGSYGRIYFYYGAGVQEYDTAYFGSYTQAAGSAAQSSTAIIEQRDGMRTLMYGTHTTGGGDINPKYHSSNIPGSYVDGFLVGTEKVYTKIIIGEVVGTAKYALYGKRKWH